MGDAPFADWLQERRAYWMRERDITDDPRRSFADGAFGAYDAALERLAGQRIIGPEDDEISFEIQRLGNGIRTALDELGVPNESYPAPVANAVGILRALLRDGETDE